MLTLEHISWPRFEVVAKMHHACLLMMMVLMTIMLMMTLILMIMVMMIFDNFDDGGNWKDCTQEREVTRSNLLHPFFGLLLLLMMMILVTIFRTVQCLLLRFFSIVCFHMSHKVACLWGCMITLVVFVCFSSTVCYQKMIPQIASRRRCIITLVTFVSLLTTVCW